MNTKHAEIVVRLILAAFLLFSAGSIPVHSVLAEQPADEVDAPQAAEPELTSTGFLDVPSDYWAAPFIVAIKEAGITGGCGPNLFCPSAPVYRGDMAIFLERGLKGSAYQPPTAAGIFEDVPLNAYYAKWVEKLYQDGVTGGCSVSPLKYCPTAKVTRAQMAVFLLKAKHGKEYQPPAATGIFSDVVPGSFFEPWIEQLAAEGITAGCGGDKYCPSNAVTRAQMAVFLTRTFIEDGRTKVRWFVGLGGGSDSNTFEAQQAIVDEFNASQDQIKLFLEIYPYGDAYEELAARIANGNAPDIIGPVGVLGQNRFKGEYLDLQPFINSNAYDLSDFDPGVVELYQTDEGQVGIPFALYPSFVIFNKDLFDEAGLPYPPANYGEAYVDEDGISHDWDIETLTQLSKKLTLDVDGNNAAEVDFDDQSIVQFGWMNQWTDARGVGTFFGSGSLLAKDGQTAQIPEHWKAAWKWTYDGWWKDYFIPNGPYRDGGFITNYDDGFVTGKLAMAHLHTWYLTPWRLDADGFGWDLAATPAYDGGVTSKLHADSFGILKYSQNPEAAFEVLTYMLSPEVALKLLDIYGGVPARLSLQEGYLETFGETNFPGKSINWDVVMAGLDYTDNPNHESWLPAMEEAIARYNEYWDYLYYTPGLDFEAETEELRAALQEIFDAAP
jgi:multiple sugar transport system substrate-binding protein